METDTDNRKKRLSAIVVLMLCIAGIGTTLAFTAEILNTGNNSDIDGMSISFYSFENRDFVPTPNGGVLGNMVLDTQTTVNADGELETSWFFGEDTSLLKNGETYIRSIDEEVPNVVGALRITMSDAEFPSDVDTDDEKTTFLREYLEAKMYEDPTATTPVEVTGLFTYADDKIVIDFTMDSTVTPAKNGTVMIGGKENKLTIGINPDKIGESADDFVGFKLTNSVVTAKFDTNTYELRYDTDPHTYAPCYFGELRTVKVAPEQAGQVFKEWNTNSEGTGTAYQPGDVLAVTGDMTLYAIWETP